MRLNVLKTTIGLIIFILLGFACQVAAQSANAFKLSPEILNNSAELALNELAWKYRPGDNAGWAARDLDDRDWQIINGTTLEARLLANDWQGRGWFRLRLSVDESLADRNFVLSGTQRGATEVFVDGRRIAEFGEISENRIAEYNPNRLPVIFRFDGAGEHVIAVRYATNTFADAASGRAKWLMNGNIYPGFSYSLGTADDVAETVGNYAVGSSMRFGFLFAGVLFSLALLHFLLFLFYRVERANFYYSIYAFSLAIFILFNNFVSFGHQPVMASTIMKTIANTMFSVSFTGLIAFVHIAFGRRIGKPFWILTAAWAVTLVASSVFLNKYGFLQLALNVLIGASFTFCILILIKALREKRSGAWILMVGIQFLMVGMTNSLLRSLKLLSLSELPNLFFDLCIGLGVPVAVSVFLARSFAGTNRDLKTQLAHIETLSAQKIEQEKHAAELRAENERRMKELEEARHLQLSMLPSKLPQLAGLELAAYMKPATEVGGDYYDFHVSDDGTLTVAVGDATGHGLKAGSVVTATKSLFNAFAGQENIPQILTAMNGALKKMNLRGLFMAMAMLKIKDRSIALGVAGMPSVLLFRAENKSVEEISLRAMPLGSLSRSIYREHKIRLGAGDCIVVMSDGFPELFNPDNEMLGFEKAAQILPEIAASSPQEIIDQLVEIGEDWARGRPQDDDVTFVVLKVTAEDGGDR